MLVSNQGPEPDGPVTDEVAIQESAIAKHNIDKFQMLGRWLQQDANSHPDRWVHDLNTRQQGE